MNPVKIVMILLVLSFSTGAPDSISWHGNHQPPAFMFSSENKKP